MKKIYIDCGTHLGEGMKKHIKAHNIDESWEIYTFEANINTYNLLKSIRDSNKLHDNYKFLTWSNIKFFNKAVWTEDGFIDFFCSTIEKCKDNISEQYLKFLINHNDLLNNNELVTSHVRYDMPIDGSSTIFPEFFQKALSNSDHVVQRNILWKQEDKISVECLDFSKFLKTVATKNDYIICKLDIEGSEYPVLNKCIKEGTLSLIDKISVEFHDYLYKDAHTNRAIIMKEFINNNVSFQEWE